MQILGRYVVAYGPNDVESWALDVRECQVAGVEGNDKHSGTPGVERI